MEELNWWEKEKKSSLYNEIKYMVPEILLLRSLKEENPRLWRLSFPFHFGLYLLIGTLALLVLGAFSMVLEVSIAPGKGAFASLLYYLTILCGFLGLILGTGGTAALLWRRLKDPELANYSAFSDAFDGARAYIYSLLTLGGLAGGVGEGHTFLGALSIVLSSLIIAYVPLTHMSHMFMKYFLYHSVRWEDTPNLKGGKMEAAILQNLGFKPTWASLHIGADGKKTWGEIATSGPKEKK